MKPRSLETRDIWARESPVAQQRINIAGRSVGVTAVFDAYWNFAAERQRVFFSRLGNAGLGSSSDPILRRFKFTNVYRASDRVSQYLIRNVIYRSDLPDDDLNVFFRILLFKLFNKIETWQFLESNFGALTWKAFDPMNWGQALDQRLKAGVRIYSAAYIMPAAGGPFESPRKHNSHLLLLAYLMRERFPQRAARAKSMCDLYELMRSAPSIGPFLAYQFAVDVNYSQLTDFHENDFVMAGPGALDGIRKCFVDAHDLSPESIIRYMVDSQEKNFSRLGLTFPSLWGRSMRLIDCQNVFCEISKYARAAYPEIAGISGRTRIKQTFTSQGELPKPWYPPKWKINEAIALTAS